MIPDVDLDWLFCQEEGEKFDLKRELHLRDDLEKSKFVKDIISMANTRGDAPAFILIGVENTSPRQVVGVAHHPDDANLQTIVKDKVSPVPRFSYRPLLHAGKSFGLLRIESGYRLHQTTIPKKYGVLEPRVIYMRRGSSNQEADASEIEQLVHDKSSRFLATQVKEQAWARGSPPPHPRPMGVWTPGRTFTGTINETSGPNGVLCVRDWLVVRLQSLPSDYWRDPAVARLCARYDPTTGAATRLHTPLVLGFPDGAETTTTHKPLCIPGYDVDVEWRDEDYLNDPVWGYAKDVVVRRFLKACGSTQILCQVIYLGTSERGAVFHLNSPDYDEYLTQEWERWKGIENALAKSKLYKQSLISSASDRDQRTIVENDLIAKGTLQQMLSPRFRNAWNNQAPDAESVLLVLRGLIRRYERRQERGTKPTTAAPS